MALIKICGINTIEAGLASARAKADLIGLNFVHKSPRYIPTERAYDLVTDIKEACYDEALDPPKVVGLFLDPGEQQLAELAPFLSYFQLHGHEEPERVAELGVEFGMEMIKAIPVSEAADVANLDEHADAAEMLIFDARPPKGADLTGGNGVAFDWTLLAGYAHDTPYLLAGGLTPDNVGEAINVAKTNAAFAGVDVSSGVESAPGVKDEKLINAFASEARKSLT